MTEKPSLEDLGLDAPTVQKSDKKTWQDIANEVDENQPIRHGKTVSDKPKWNGIAAVLSFFIPGLGQLYKGHVFSGITLFCCTLLGYGFFVVPGLVLHVITIVDAGSR